jgi:dTMP kinase
MSNGIFITFEGIDGAGKSTHIDALAAAFDKQGRAVTLTREPGGTPLAESLRNLLLGSAMDPLCEALLMFAARRDHLTQVIEPALARGNVVLCDRFTDATFAYQGYGRGVDLAVLSQLEAWVQQRADGPDGHLRQPDLTVWFDVPPEVAAKRLAQARSPDRFEAEPLAFFQRLAHGYAQRRSAEPQRFARIDANAAREAVWQQVQAAFEGKGWLGSGERV